MIRLAVLCLALLAVAGCTAETPEQQGARELVEVHIAGDARYDGHVRCTRNPRPWFIPRRADVYICAARRQDGDCDWFRVTRAAIRAKVTFDTERGGCVLPV